MDTLQLKCIHTLQHHVWIEQQLVAYARESLKRLPSIFSGLCEDPVFLRHCACVLYLIICILRTAAGTWDKSVQPQYMRVCAEAVQHAQTLVQDCRDTY